MKKEEKDKKAPFEPKNKMLNAAYRVGVELVSGVIVGIGIGWLLDKWCETSPLFFIIFFFLGSAAGMSNVFKTLRKMGLYGDKNDKNNDSRED